MKILLVINAYTDECLRQTFQLTTFLRQNHIPDGDAAAVGFGPASREELLLECFRSLPVNNGIIVKSADCRPEQILAWMEENLPRPDLCLFPGDGFGQEMAVRLAVRWKGSSLTGVTSLDPLTGLAGRPFYAGHLEGRFRLPEQPYVLSVDPGLEAEPLSASVRSRDAEPLSSASAWSRDAEPLSSASALQTILRYEIPAGEQSEMIVRSRPESDNRLRNASRVVICGMGIGNKRNAEEVTELANSISMEIGATRPAVMNAWFPTDRLVGVSGAMIAPEVCILLGVSGAPAFYSGIKHAGKIIAVNQDRNAPVMKKADLGIVGDCMDVFRSFVNQL
ncbi:MAG: electron transfer flavoprotein subunit alpha/FixB family protein [Eubacterium sp.]|nr:electron transfer flavoprotein subunit alpha/FixB family protein [Eubacterium sp.]